MRTTVFGLIGIFLLGFLGFKLFFEDVPVAAPVQANPVPRQEGSVADLEPNSPPPKMATLPPPRPAKSEQSESEAIHPASLEPGDADHSSQSGIIKVHVPEQYENRPGIVNLVHKEGDSGPEFDRLDNVAQVFDESKDAVQTFGDQLNALNGKYQGSVQREGEEPCPVTMTIDGLYTPSESQKKGEFSGNFGFELNCKGESSGKPHFSSFTGHAKVLGENARVLLFKDAVGNYFQLSFSNDFYKASGHAYEASGFLGKVSVQKL